MTMDVDGALRRAKIRLRYHGWRRTTDSKPITGFTLKEAIIGHRPTVIPEHELQAIVAVCEAIGISPDEIIPWNDAPYREAKDVLKAISKARKSIKAPLPKVPDRCAQRRMAAAGEVMTESLDENWGDIPAEEASESTGPLEHTESQVDLEEVIKDHLRGN